MTVKFSGLLLALALPLCAAPKAHPNMLVSTAWLAKHASDPKVVVLYVAQDRSSYAAGHIPGSRYIDWNSVVCTRGGLRNELPPARDLQQTFEAAGVSDDSRIVLHGDGLVLSAARAYFTLDYLGHGDHTALLDGGLQKWIAEKRPLSKESPAVKPGRLTPRPRPEVVIKRDVMFDLSWAARLSPAATLLLDARPPEEYSGVKPPAGVTRPGHIPGAVNLYWRQGLASHENPVWRSVSELRKMFETAGATPGRAIAVYCNSGHQASASYFTLKYLGYDVRLYDGSMSDWLGAAGAPVEK